MTKAFEQWWKNHELKKALDDLDEDKDPVATLIKRMLITKIAVESFGAGWELCEANYSTHDIRSQEAPAPEVAGMPVYEGPQ